MYYNENTNLAKPRNPAFFNEVRYACDYGADGVAIFAWHWLKEFNGGYIDGQNIMDTLHNMPPSSCEVSPTPTPTPTPVLSLIKNPGFELGTASWLFYTSGTGTFSTVSPDYEGSNTAQLALSSGGSNIQLYQEGIALEPNTRYRLSFAAYSTTGHDVTVRLLKHVSPYTAYAPDFTANLGTNWQTFTTEFTTSGFTSTVTDGRLQFWLATFAASGDNYYIDDIRLEKVSALELPTISTHPADQTVVTGQTATFSVVATGTAPLTYQWQKNSVDIHGATNPSYTTPATILEDSGSTFCVQVTNPAGSIMSNAATCTVGTLAPVLSVMYYFMSDNLVLKNLPNSKEYLECLLSLMESFYFYPAS